MNSPITIQYQILVVYNLTEISFQGCSANQTTIDVRLCEQLCCISCIYRSAVLDTNRISSSLIIDFSYTCTDCAIA